MSLVWVGARVSSSCIATVLLGAPVGNADACCRKRAGHVPLCLGASHVDLIVRARAQRCCPSMLQQSEQGMHRLGRRWGEEPIFAGRQDFVGAAH
jgi:hypothetical protein